MPEAVTTTVRTFAAPARRAVSSNQEAQVPQEPMQTPHPTSPSPLAAFTSRRASRGGKQALAAVLALLVLLTVAGPASAFSTQYQFTIDGHGWGHGVGMSQWGAYGFARQGTPFDQILAHYYQGTTLGPAPLARVRVLLVPGQARVTVSSVAPFRVRDSLGQTYELTAGPHQFLSLIHI